MLDRSRIDCYSMPVNKLPIAKRAQILSLLVEDNSLRAASRLADCSINTVTKLLVDGGTAAAVFHHEKVRNVRAQRQSRAAHATKIRPTR